MRATVVERGDGILLVDRAGVVRELVDDSAELARSVLAFVTRPRTRAEIIAHVEGLAGESLAPAQQAVLESLLQLLVDTGAVERGGGSLATRSPRPRNIVVAASGAIAATQVPAL